MKMNGSTGAAGIAAVGMALALGACNSKPNPFGGGRCPEVNYGYCCAIQYQPKGTHYPMGTLTEMWKVYATGSGAAVANATLALYAEGAGPVIAATCLRDPANACKPARTILPTNGGPTVQSYSGSDPKLRLIQSAVQNKQGASSNLPHAFGLACDQCTGEAAGTTCASQLSDCNADAICAACVSCLDGGGLPATCGCDLSNSAVLTLGTCLYQACPVCSGTGAGGGTTTSLLPTGASCSNSDQCESCICDADNNTCL